MSSTSTAIGNARHSLREMRSHPTVALLSNASYGVLITSAGTGSSSWRDLDVTRWREDATRDCWGQFVYIRDLGDNRAWSVGTQPLVHSGDPPDFDVRAGRAELHRRDGDVETRCAVCVVPDADAELRVVTLVNHGERRYDLEVTSYAEVCLNARRADQAHVSPGEREQQAEERKRHRSHGNKERGIRENAANDGADSEASSQRVKITDLLHRA